MDRVKSIETTTENMIEAIVRILSDVRPQHTVDAAYLFAQTSDNESSVIHGGKKIIDESVVSKILMLRTRSMNGYTGFDDWKAKLIDLGIPETRIAPVVLHPSTPHNTLTESIALIRLAKQKGYKAIVVTAAPFHQVRAFMTVVRVVLTWFPDLKIYSFPGMALPWTEQVVHSQGILTATRARFIETEFERIDTYHRKGDLMSFDEVLRYLDQRDNLS
jgi:hypothetical protein